MDKDSVQLTVETDEGKYRPGKIAFTAAPGRSINLGKIQEAIAATRLSGGTNMRVDYLQITVRGDLAFRDGIAVLEVANAPQQFLLEADDRVLEKQVLQAARQGTQRVTVVGRVDGWNGRFPVVLRTLARRYGTDGKKPILLIITSLETNPSN